MMKNLKFLFLSLVAIMMFALVACGNEADNENVQNNDHEDEVPSSVTLTDDTGTEVTIEGDVDRIISLIPSTTEMVFALGLGDKVVGVSEFDNFPAEVTDIEKVIGMEADVEKIVELEPDLVLADIINGDAITQLREQGLTVFAIESNNLEEVFEDITSIGELTGASEKAEAVVSDMKETRDNVVATIEGVPADERKTVYIETGEGFYSIGSGTFMANLLSIAGGENIFADQEGWLQASEESVLEENPDVIFITYGAYMDDAVGSVLNRANWENITAIQEEQVYELTSDLVSRPGPRVVEGLREMAEYLYPDQF
ncbi:ABC transporter substrate-binding protein [Salirhabdus salicampi]|uniref:ABC transporter substrate-binding protein n=1 Tax=Salirhabdus salicampi TaxID=476102 RepID=UPI0020C25C9B|nr:ABC transporter substrate-binding protein [Salirhabdus salicampi]MCP8618111.1 ABC transporter substrate-binding protein [Salirhabdus salicampi]